MAAPSSHTPSDIGLLQECLVKESARIVSRCTLSPADEKRGEANPSVLDSIQSHLPRWLAELISLLPDVMTAGRNPPAIANDSIECSAEHRLDVVIKTLSGIREMVVLELLQLKGAVADSSLAEACREAKVFFDFKMAGYALQFVAAYEQEAALHTRRLKEAREQMLPASEASATAAHARLQLLQAVDHELRNTLQSVLLYATSVVEGPRDPGMVEIVERLATNGTRLQRLLDRLRACSSLLAGGLQACPGPGDLCGFLTELEQKHRALAAAGKTRLTFTLEGGLKTVMTDRALLHQIADHLLSNAIHSARSGMVEVEVAQEGPQRFSLRVADNGAGVSLTEARQIFRVLHQTSDSHSDALRLGLLTSRCLAHLLGGEITFTSKAGHGASFVLSLPTGL